ncbi:unnamed protein product [Timema podura]|uniref:Uncharacterized protein n=1 Tax=Timema podura TaxID=61482 RepID=A0ABN7PJE8_TIMPD|nr:unnamed protein product [Timema podura]
MSRICTKVDLRCLPEEDQHAHFCRSGWKPWRWRFGQPSSRQHHGPHHHEEAVV